MAGKKENIKALFSNTRSRVIILFTVMLLLVTVIIGFIKFSSSTADHDSGVILARAPARIESIPGVQDQTAQYAALQETQNLDQAQKARQSGDSAIPTIIRTQAFGEGVDIIGMKEGEGGVGFTSLARGDLGGTQKSLWVQSLKEGNCDKASLEKSVSQGAQLSDLREACSCKQLKEHGYKITELEPVCTCADLKSAGFDIVQMKEAGFTAGRLRLCGYVACDEKGVGFSAQQMKDAGFSDGELKGAGFSEQAIAIAGGVPEGMNIADIKRSGCDVEAQKKLRAAGVSAAAIRRISGCSPVQLKAAGFGAQDLLNAGYSAADLKGVGFGAAELKQAGFGPRELLNAGFTGDDLANAGFSGTQIKAAEAILPYGLTPDDIKKAGCSPEAIKRERLAGVSVAMIRKYAGCKIGALKQSGFSGSDLLGAGFKAAEINALPSQVPELVDDKTIREAGCDPVKIKVLIAKGVSAKRIRDLNGCRSDSLKSAGFDATSLANAGFTPSDLFVAGFSPEQLIKAGLSPTGVIAAGRKADCNVSSLKAARALGVSAATIKQTLGCSSKALKDAGYDSADLKNSGFTAAELGNAGFTAADLKNAGYSAKDLRAAGFTPQQLITAGFNPVQLKEAGYSAGDLKAAGLSAAQLKTAGFDVNALKEAGFGVDALRKAGFSGKEIKDAGFTAGEMKQAGMSDQDLRDAGFSSVAGLDAVTPLPPVASAVTTIPSLGGVVNATNAAKEAANAKQLERIRAQQTDQMAAQRYQQKIQQKSSVMLSAANQALSGWKVAPQQTLIESSEKEEGNKGARQSGEVGGINGLKGMSPNEGENSKSGAALVKTGDVLFAVIDTSVNSDQPGPILATIVSGKLKGSRLIGSFNLPSNSDEMVITFNTLSIPGADKTVSIKAFAIDPNTARTALSSQSDHHYLMRYGSLFAATFLEGFGNAFQSADTTITVGGTGGTTDTTVANGINRSLLENAVIGLATLGKAWGQVAAQQMSRPTTVEVFSGTGVGVLFTQDLRLT